MKRVLFIVILVVFASISFAGVKPFVDAYFSTSLVQNVDDKYLREHYGPYRFGQQYGDNRWYLRDSRLSFIFGLGVREENLFGSIDFYMNSFLDGSTMLDINSGVVGYSDEVFTVKGFFKNRAIKFRNSPSEMFFSYLPSLQLFSSTFSRAHWFVPYFLYPIEFIDGSVEIFSTAREDTTNLVYGGKDYYGMYVSYFDGIIDIEGYFAKNIYGSIGDFQNSAFFNRLTTGNFGGLKIGGAGNVGIGDVYIGALYREMTTNNLGYLMKTSDYRWYHLSPYSGSNNYTYSLPYVASLPTSYAFIGGYISFDIVDLAYLGLEGGVIRDLIYIGTNRTEIGSIYAVVGLMFKGIEGMKVEVSSLAVLPENTSNITVLGIDFKSYTYYNISIITDEDEIKTLLKLSLRDSKIEKPSKSVTTVVGIGNVGYLGGDVSIDLLGYINNSSVWDSVISLSTNILYSDLRLYTGYRLSSLFDSKTRKSIGDNLWLKVGGRSFVQVGNVNVGNVGENVFLTPYIGIWYQIPKVDSYITISYGWYGMTSVNDLDLGRNLEAVVVMYNGAKDFSSGLVMPDNLASTIYSDGKMINTGEYKLAVEPTIRFDMYIRY